MAVTYGFYNSLNGDRTYNAEQMSAIFDGIITDGVFSSIGGALMTIAGEGMQVLVKTGKAWFNSTWTLNDAQMALAVDTADVSLTRIDAVVLEVNSGVSTRENSIKMVKGTPSANPTKPTMASDEDLHQYALAYITVGAGVTSITSANIEVNVGKDSCPFITSVLQQTSVSDLFNQWEAEFDAWFANIKAQLAGDVATNLQSQIDELKIGKTAQEQYGLTSVYPNDYIEWLGKYNEYWWSLHYDTSQDVYEELQTTIAESKYFYYSEKQTNSSFTMPEITINYSKNISIDQSTGSVTLLDPQSLTIPSKSNMLGSQYQIKENEINDLISSSIIAYAPCYCEFDDGTICYIPYGATGNSTSSGAKIGTIYTEVYRKKDSDGDFDYGWVSIKLYYSNVSGQVNGALVSSELKHYESGYTTYVHSTDRNAYPDSGTVYGITYTYLGCPFEKLPGAVQMVVGSYTGAGVYGSNNYNRLDFDFAPKLLMVRNNNHSYGGDLTSDAFTSDSYNNSIIVDTTEFQVTDDFSANTPYTNYVKLNGQSGTSSWNLNVYFKKSTDGKTIVWKADSVGKQLNRTTTKYYYVALG